MSRPSRVESKSRALAFMQHVADGYPGDVAAKAARIKPERALRIACDPGFQTVILALKVGVPPEELGKRVAA